MNIVDQNQHPLNSAEFRLQCKQTLDKKGVLILANFLTPSAVAAIAREGIDNQHLAYYTASSHNIYLSPEDPTFSNTHPRNRNFESSKGCITTDQIPRSSALRKLYNAVEFNEFLCSVLDEAELYEYADPLSSINMHYAKNGQELGWHFDNSSFAITLMIQSPDSGGRFEYVKDVRDAKRGEVNDQTVEKILNGEMPTQTVAMETGTLVMFRGRNSMHRVTPVEGSTTRMLVVLAYNTVPGIALSESARMTFYGRLSLLLKFFVLTTKLPGKILRKFVVFPFQPTKRSCFR